MRAWILLWMFGCASAQPTWAEGSAANPATNAAPLSPVATALTRDPAPMPEEGAGGGHGHHHHGHHGHHSAATHETPDAPAAPDAGTHEGHAPPAPSDAVTHEGHDAPSAPPASALREGGHHAH